MKKITINDSGLTEPIFLCQKEMASVRLYLDLHPGSTLRIEGSYDPEHIIQTKPHDMLWQELGYGLITSDFACEAFGLTALRFRVAVQHKEQQPHVTVTIEKGV